jgi:hypothetical protein
MKEPLHTSLSLPGFQIRSAFFRWTAAGLDGRFVRPEDRRTAAPLRLRGRDKIID